MLAYMRKIISWFRCLAFLCLFVPALKVMAKAWIDCHLRLNTERQKRKRDPDAAPQFAQSFHCACLPLNDHLPCNADEIDLVAGDQNGATRTLSFDDWEAPGSFICPPASLLLLQPVLLLFRYVRRQAFAVYCRSSSFLPTRLNGDTVYSAFRPVGDEQTSNRFARDEIGRRPQPRHRKSSLQRQRDCTVDFYFRRLGANHEHVTGSGGYSEHGTRLFWHRLNDFWRHWILRRPHDICRRSQTVSSHVWRELFIIKN